MIEILFLTDKYKTTPYEQLLNLPRDVLKVKTLLNFILYTATQCKKGRRYSKLFIMIQVL